MSYFFTLKAKGKAAKPLTFERQSRTIGVNAVEMNIILTLLRKQVNMEDVLSLY